MSERIILGISGLSNSGKDTSADHLVSKHYFAKISFADPLKRIAQDVYNFTREQLWGPSGNRNAPDKRYIRAFHERHDWQEDSKGWICSRCEKSGEEAGSSCSVYLTPRFALQELGTGWGRTCYQNTWVDYAIRKAQQVLGPNPYGAKYGYDASSGLLSMGQSLPNHAGVAIPDVRFRNEIDALRKVNAKLVRIIRPGSGLKGSAGLHPSEQEQLDIPDTEFDLVIHNDSTLDSLYSSISEATTEWLGS